MRYNKEYGLNLDYSSDINMIGDNVIVGNLKYGLVLGSVSNNVLRNNSMSDNQFNFYVVLARPNIGDYLNEIDPSNMVNGKEIHYIVNRENLVINSTFYPNMGYLALVNSTGITVKGLNFTGNGQALLLAFTSNSTLENLGASNNNHGIQLCSSSYVSVRNCVIANNSADGITVDNSSLNNTVVDNVIASNERGIRVVHSSQNNTISRNKITDNDKGMWIFSYSSDNMITNNFVVGNHIGISLQRVSPSKITGNTIANNTQGLFLETSGNLIYHNNFVNNTVQVETRNSSSTWDLGYSSGGNYWSDYKGEDANGDSIGDVPYVMDENNMDPYPLISFWTEADEKPPAIGFPTCFPSDDIQPYEEVTVYVAVTDVGSGLKNVTLFYTIDNGASWAELRMTYNSSCELFMAVLPVQAPETLVKYKIVACDNAGNVAIKDNSGQLFTYRVIPEFSSIFFAVSFLTTTIILLCIVKTVSHKNRCKSIKKVTT
jgi:parallel beta-helix repeat protein